MKIVGSYWAREVREDATHFMAQDQGKCKLFFIFLKFPILFYFFVQEIKAKKQSKTWADDLEDFAECFFTCLDPKCFYCHASYSGILSERIYETLDLKLKFTIFRYKNDFF